MEKLGEEMRRYVLATTTDSQYPSVVIAVDDSFTDTEGNRVSMLQALPRQRR